jgi:peptidoglycan/LPS O-acetylase OafA/YrhL
MLEEKSLNEDKKNNKKRRQPLNYIAFIKFWAMILIIKWHLFQDIKCKINYGARMCELLFVSSGFLVGYNYYKREMPATYYISFKYAYKHLRSFYPLHIINSLYTILTIKGKFNLTLYEKLIFNFLLVKAYAMGFNGISWFINVLLLCYFLSPLLLVGIRNINNSLIIFFLWLLFV